MSDRDKILRYYKTSGSGEQAARLLDAAEAVVKNRKYRISEFLDLHGLTITETIASHYPVLKNLTNGGYSGAQRAKIAFVHKDYMGEADFTISALAVKWDTRYYELSHRDVLGALLDLGIKREVIGDVVMETEGCQVILDIAMADFVSQNLIRIGTVTVSVQELELDKIDACEEKIKEIRRTVISLRLDVVAAVGFGVSRTKMSENIAMQKIKINWQNAKNSAQVVKEGDIISLRGRGRIEVCAILAKTKKDRTSIVIKRYV